MAARVYISYRRDDSAGHAGRVHDRLEREFGQDLLFMDVDAATPDAITRGSAKRESKSLHS